MQLRHLIHEVAAIIKETFPKSIQIHVHAPTDLWLVLGNATQLHQALMNLAVNARYAMPGGGELKVTAKNMVIGEAEHRLHPDAKAGPHVAVQVADSGTGIPVEILDKIFDPFFSTRPLGQGTGLGLATTLGIVKGHGGTIQVNSEPGRGTRFKLFLPAIPSAQDHPTQAEQALLPTGNGELVLVADDESAIREMARLALESYGYRVVLAADGTEGVAVCAQQTREVKVAVVDMMMPFLDGPATVRALKRLNPALKLIGISGVMDPAKAGGVAPAEVQAFLTKPFSAQQLVKAVHDALQP